MKDKLLIVICLTIGITIQNMALAQVTIQDDPVEYATIQEAVNAASSGDILNVQPGRYSPTNTIVITIPLVLRGAQAGVDPRTAAALRTPGSAAESIIDGTNSTLANVFSIQADNVTIDGFEVINGTSDLITSPSDTTINNPLIRYNLIHEATGDEGMQLRNAVSAIVEYNRVFHTVGDGLNLAGASVNGIIRHNEVHDISSTNAAIYLDGAQTTTVQENLIYNVTGNDGIKVGDKGGSNADDSGGDIINNIIHDTAQDGIAVYMSDVAVSGNEIYNSTSENGAIFVEFDVTNIEIKNNNIHDVGKDDDGRATFAIRIGKDNTPVNVSITDNTFKDNEVQVFATAGSVNNAATLTSDNTADNTATMGVNVSVGAVSGDPVNIQSAIASAAQGSKIFVPAGTYSEVITVNKPVTLVGAQAGVDARTRSNLPESIISGRINLKADSDTTGINGFTILNGSSSGGEKAGINLASGAADITVTNTVFEREGDVDGDSYRGILSNSNSGINNLVVSNNHFSGWATGLYLNPGAVDARVSDNTFNNNFVGMSVDAPANTLVSGNLFTNNVFEGLGIGPGGTSPTITLSGNQFKDNKTHVGVYADLALDLSGNTITGGVSVSGNPFVYSSIQDAIDQAQDGDTITATAGSYAPFSVPASGPTDLTITAQQSATISVAGTGSIQRIIDLRANQTTLSGFSIDGGGNHVGISISGQEVEVTGNTISNVLTGIQTTTQFESGGNTITGNNISDSDYGISLQNNNNVVTGNSIAVTTEAFGIGSAGNTISSNQLKTAVTGRHFQTYSNTDYTALPGADIDLPAALDANTFNRVVQVTNGAELQVQTLFAGIQPAIAAAPASSTISVSSGTFVENVSIDKPLILSGAGSSTILAPVTGNAISIAGHTHAGSSGVAGIDGVTIRNFVINGASGGFGLISLSNTAPAGQYDVANLAVSNITFNTHSSGFSVGLFDVIDASFTNVTINNHLNTTTGAFELVGVANLAINNNRIGSTGLSFNIFEVDGYADNSTTVIRNSSLLSLKIAGTKAVVDARNNFWGNASNPTSGITGTAQFDPWYVNAAFSQLSNFVPPVVQEPEPEAPTPVVITAQGNDDVEDQIDNITINDDDTPLDESTVTAVNTALENSKNLSANTKNQISNGQVSTNDALEVINTLGKALNLAGNANQKGATVSKENTRAALTGITDILDSISTSNIASGGSINPLQMEQVKTVTQQAVNSASKLISTTSTSNEVSTVIADVGQLLSKSAKVGNTLDSTLTANAKSLSEQALKSSLATVSAELKIKNANINTDDKEATKTLLKANPKLLNKVVSTVGVVLPSSIALNTTELANTLGNQGLGSVAAEKISMELSQFVNPAGVNLELTNGTTVNAGTSLAGSISASARVDVDDNTGAVLVSNGSAAVPVKVQSVSIVPDSIPEGISFLPDGSVLSVANGVAVKVIPSPKDPIALVSALEGTAEVTLKNNGGITMKNANATFSGSFGFQNTTKNTGSGGSSATFVTPTGGDPTDPDYIYSVEYPDGTRQEIAPFVSNDNFFSSLETRGLEFSTARNNGVISVGGSQFRPDYFVLPLSTEDQTFLDANADGTGVAYRAIDINSDDKVDFQVISADGVQVIYGL